MKINEWPTCHYCKRTDPELIVYIDAHGFRRTVCIDSPACHDRALIDHFTPTKERRYKPRKTVTVPDLGEAVVINRKIEHDEPHVLVHIPGMRPVWIAESYIEYH